MIVIIPLGRTVSGGSFMQLQLSPGTCFQDLNRPAMMRVGARLEEYELWCGVDLLSVASCFMKSGRPSAAFGSNCSPWPNSSIIHKLWAITRTWGKETRGRQRSQNFESPPTWWKELIQCLMDSTIGRSKLPAAKVQFHGLSRMAPMSPNSSYNIPVKRSREMKLLSL